jgi:hypothetical protein
VVFGFRNAAGRAVAAIERRRVPRVALKHGVAKIDSKSFPVKNLSTQGFVLEPYQGDLITHQRVYLTLVLAINGQERDFATDAVVVRAADQTLAGRFSDLRHDARRAIEQYFLARPAGQPG